MMTYGLSLGVDELQVLMLLLRVMYNCSWVIDQCLLAHLSLLHLSMLYHNFIIPLSSCPQADKTITTTS